LLAKSTIGSVTEARTIASTAAQGYRRPATVREAARGVPDTPAGIRPPGGWPHWARRVH
jgi:hypothetical protein